ncbi:DUF6313 family protein [Nonomuraea rubra]
MTPAGTEPPPRAPLVARCRRFVRSLAALSKTRYWLLTRALWVALVFIVVFVVDGVLIGWATAYEVLIGIKSPADAGSAPVTWLVSIVGWLAIPAFVGGTVGYLVTRQIEARRRRSTADVVEDLRRRARDNRRPGSRR